MAPTRAPGLLPVFWWFVPKRRVTLRAGFISRLGRAQRKHGVQKHRIRANGCTRARAVWLDDGVCRALEQAQERLSLAAVEDTVRRRAEHRSNAALTTRSRAGRKNGQDRPSARLGLGRGLLPVGRRAPPPSSAPTRTSRPTSAAAGSPSPAASRRRTRRTSSTTTTTREATSTTRSASRTASWAPPGLDKLKEQNTGGNNRFYDGVEGSIGRSTPTSSGATPARRPRPPA